MAFFDVTDPQGRRQFSIRDEVIKFGRLLASNVQLRDPSCSRAHFEIQNRGDGYWLVDVGSRNKTYLNGKPLVATTKLNPGDVIKAGHCTVAYEPSDVTRKTLAPPAPAKPAAPVYGKPGAATASPARPGAAAPVPVKPAATAAAAISSGVRAKSEAVTEPYVPAVKAPGSGSSPAVPRPVSANPAAAARGASVPPAVPKAKMAEENSEATRLAPAAPVPVRPVTPPAPVAAPPKQAVPVPAAAAPKPVLAPPVPVIEDAVPTVPPIPVPAKERGDKPAPPAPVSSIGETPAAAMPPVVINLDTPPLIKAVPLRPHWTE
jgi:predicted component of type VI protein secretion system